MTSYGDHPSRSIVNRDDTTIPQFRPDPATKLLNQFTIQTFDSRATMEYRNKQLLFGPRWDLYCWTASDDRVRGGSSVSELVSTAEGVLFRGHLDFETLGGAGFASQRTVGNDETWDLTGQDGIVLCVGKSDGKRYTFSLTDEIPGRRSDGREESALVWEYDFCTEETGHTVRVPWRKLKPTYRGKEVENARPLDLSHVRRFRIMIRSFFGKQEGDFSLEIHSIGLFRESYLDNPSGDESIDWGNEKVDGSYEPKENGSWISGCCALF
ncbi:hypothetical protein N7535_001752 [Penicillium sp. DV-2018c]|nr:hypothetical protein N7535_001752 [Penicillium sp. DV-2018c]